MSLLTEFKKGACSASVVESGGTVVIIAPPSPAHHFAGQDVLMPPVVWALGGV